MTTVRSCRRADSTSDGGAVLIVALWIMLFLGVLAAAIASRVSGQLGFAMWLKSRTGAYYAARAGIEAAIDFYSDTNEWKTIGPLPPERAAVLTDAEIGGNRFSVFSLSEAEDGTMVTNPGPADEDARISLNWATNEAGRAAIKSLLHAAGGLEWRAADEVSRCIADWIDPDGTPMEYGAESDYYLALRTGGYRCPDASFSCIEELQLVKGVDSNLFARVCKYLTAHRDNGAVNLNTAGEVVLKSLAFSRKGAEHENGENLVRRIMEYRERGGVFEDPDKRVIRQILFENVGPEGEEAGEWAVLEWLINQNLISVQSRYLCGISQGISGQGDPVRRNIEFVYDREKNVMRAWREH